MSASYPGSVKAFATRSNGQTIDASHVNDVQDEITAIEGGITQGTAPLNSSNSTVVNLSVTGNSTIAGTLTVTGTLTAGTFAFSTTVTANAQSRAKVFHGSTQAIPNNTETALTFNSEDFDVGALHSTASSPTRITCGTTGLWMFGAVVNFSTGGANDKQMRFRKNGSVAVGAMTSMSAFASGFGPRLALTTIEQVSSATDYVEVMVYQNSGASLESGNGSSRVDQNEFWAMKVW